MSAQHAGSTNVARAGVADGHAEAGAGDGVDVGLRHGLPVHRLPAVAGPLGEQLRQRTLQSCEPLGAVAPQD